MSVDVRRPPAAVYAAIAAGEVPTGYAVVEDDPPRLLRLRPLGSAGGPDVTWTVQPLGEAAEHARVTAVVSDDLGSWPAPTAPLRHWVVQRRMERRQRRLKRRLEARQG
jgi:hypothetical protein